MVTGVQKIDEAFVLQRLSFYFFHFILFPLLFSLCRLEESREKMSRVMPHHFFNNLGISKGNKGGKVVEG